MMFKKIYILLILLSSLGTAIYAQQEDILSPQKIYSDRITDQDGNPLIGIRVRVKGTNIIAYTDANGHFSIRAKNGDVIELSKDGKFINSYRLDGSIYYRVEDMSDQIPEREENQKRTTSKKLQFDNSEAFISLIDSASYFKKSNPTKSIDYIEDALVIANDTRNSKQISEAYAVLGDVYMNLKQYDLAVGNYRISVRNLNTVENVLKYANALKMTGNYIESIDQYNILLKDSRLSTVQEVDIYMGLGDVYFKQGVLDKANEAYQTALNMAMRSKLTSKMAELNAKIAALLESSGQTAKAESYLLKSNVADANKNPEEATIESQRAADFYSRNRQLDKEVKLRQQTLDNLEKNNLDKVEDEKEGITITKQRAKLDLGNALLKQQNVKEAIPILEQSAEEAADISDLETQKDAVQKLSEAYVFLGDDNKALTNYKKYVALVDAIYKQKEHEIEEMVSLSQDLSEKQNRITSLEKDRELSESKLRLFQTEQQLTEENYRRQQMIIYSLIGGLLLLLFSLFWMLRSNRQKRLANNLLALKSLRTQMNPHFIFNALNSVNSFIAQNDERAANRYLTEFSTLMRSVLENSEEDFISLEKEIELLELYLKLEHSRFQDKFDYELIIDKNIDLEAYQIPPMLLQPYIENAVWHGLRYKQEKGFLKVELLKRDEESIQIIISDNGIGRRKSAELKTEYQKKKRSKGMQNIKQRITILNEMYKDKVDVFIEDLYDDTTGTKVILTLKKD